MISLEGSQLVFRFPEVHKKAKLSIDFKRTLRIPDDGTDYPLPAGLGNFPIEHVDDYQDNVPLKWTQQGGVMLPMHQCEAMWINFKSSHLRNREAPYFFAVRFACGKVDAITGDTWKPGLKKKKQNYVVVPGQPWIDGFCVEQGVIRQFVAMQLGEGYTVEEQVTGSAEHGGVQIQVFPMKREVFDKRFPKIVREPIPKNFDGHRYPYALHSLQEVGLGMGGRMRQQIHKDPFKLSDWDLESTSRCFVHLANSQIWNQITGQPTPESPVNQYAYEQEGLPWFDHYQEKPTVHGSQTLKNLKSVKTISEEKGQAIEKDEISFVSDPVNVSK